MGRPSRYDSDIKPHLDQIRKAVESGATVKEICKAFNIAESTMYKYQNEKKELSEAFAHGREVVVIEIKAALLKKALGYEYEEEKRVGKKDKDGENIILVEKYKKHMPPSETAAAMLLRNYETEWLDRDNVSTDLRKQELELRKAIAKENSFDLKID